MFEKKRKMPINFTVVGLFQTVQCKLNSPLPFRLQTNKESKVQNEYQPQEPIIESQKAIMESSWIRKRKKKCGIKRENSKWMNWIVFNFLITAEVCVCRSIQAKWFHVFFSIVFHKLPPNQKHLHNMFIAATMHIGVFHFFIKPFWICGKSIECVFKKEQQSILWLDSAMFYFSSTAKLVCSSEM